MHHKSINISRKCSKHDGYGSFCPGFLPSLLSGMRNNPIPGQFNPIVTPTSLSPKFISRQLRSQQPKSFIYSSIMEPPKQVPPNTSSDSGSDDSLGNKYSNNTVAPNSSHRQQSVELIGTNQHVNLTLDSSSASDVVMSDVTRLPTALTQRSEAHESSDHCCSSDDCIDREHSGKDVEARTSGREQSVEFLGSRPRNAHSVEIGSDAERLDVSRLSLYWLRGHATPEPVPRSTHPHSNDRSKFMTGALPPPKHQLTAPAIPVITAATPGAQSSPDQLYDLDDSDDLDVPLMELRASVRRAAPPQHGITQDTLSNESGTLDSMSKSAHQAGMVDPSMHQVALTLLELAQSKSPSGDRVQKLESTPVSPGRASKKKDIASYVLARDYLPDVLLGKELRPSQILEAVRARLPADVGLSKHQLQNRIRYALKPRNGMAEAEGGKHGEFRFKSLGRGRWTAIKVGLPDILQDNEGTDSEDWETIGANMLLQRAYPRGVPPFPTKVLMNFPIGDTNASHNSQVQAHDEVAPSNFRHQSVVSISPNQPTECSATDPQRAPGPEELTIAAVQCQGTQREPSIDDSAVSNPFSPTTVETPATATSFQEPMADTRAPALNAPLCAAEQHTALDEQRRGMLEKSDAKQP